MPNILVNPLNEQKPAQGQAAPRLTSLEGTTIGLLDINWGGTRAEPWTPSEAMKKHPRFRDRIDDADAATQEIGRRDPGVMFNAMLDPFIPYGIRGAIWYQGESNSKQPDEYASLLPLMRTRRAAERPAVTCLGNRGAWIRGGCRVRRTTEARPCRE